jgi:hypothetical protein
MQPVKLAWSDREEVGKVYFSSDFKNENSVFQVDALNDWIHDLQNVRDALLAQEMPVVKSLLWGLE